MKTYKLLKKYPSICKRMNEGDEVVFSPSMALYSHDLTLSTFDPAEVEQNPEYWEELVPISVVKDSFTGTHYKLQENGKWRDVGSYPEASPISTIEYTISTKEIREGNRYKIIELPVVTYEVLLVKHSSGIQERPLAHNIERLLNTCDILEIRRLSDGEIFKVGDTVVRNFLPPVGTEIVQSIEINEHFTGGVCLRCINYATCLKDAKIYVEPTPLFVTEDGHAIFGDGTDDPYHIVHLNYMKYGGCVNYPQFSKESSGKWLRFHSEVAAVEYMIQHKKCLSLNDIEKIVGEVDTEDVRCTIVELIQERL